MTYTREQLIQAQLKVNIHFSKKPEDFNDEVSTTEKGVTEYIDYLLSQVE